MDAYLYNQIVQGNYQFEAFGLAQDYELRFKEILKQYLKMKYAYKKSYLANLQLNPDYQSRSETHYALAQESNLEYIKTVLAEIGAQHGLDPKNADETSQIMN